MILEEIIGGTSGVKQIIKGTSVLNATSIVVPITTIDASKSIFIAAGMGTSSNTSTHVTGDEDYSATLTNTTLTLDIQSFSASRVRTLNWQIIEYN